MKALRTKRVEQYWKSEVKKLSEPLRVQIRDLVASSLKDVTDTALINYLV